MLPRRAKKGTPITKLPPKPVLARESLRSWNVPAKSPSDAASCYNGMFGVFKGLNIKGVLFHQGYNNRFDCRPERYRILMKQMIEGWREDFQDPNLPVGVIAGCGSGGEIQNCGQFRIAEHFAADLHPRSAAAWPKRCRRSGEYRILARLRCSHPGSASEKRNFRTDFRAARWALNTIYGFGKQVEWDPRLRFRHPCRADVMVVAFDKPVRPDDHSLAIEGFSIAGADGKYYMAHAAYQTVAKKPDFTKIHVWSPLVKEPVAVRYAWASSGPMGNLKVNGREWLPVPTFRTDKWGTGPRARTRPKISGMVPNKKPRKKMLKRGWIPSTRRSSTGGGNPRKTQNIRDRRSRNPRNSRRLCAKIRQPSP